MASWAAKRQLLYSSIIIIALLLIIGTPSYFYFFNKTATCFDNKQNQDETGVDCGGGCEKACKIDVVALPVTIWSRAFPVTNGIYNLAAYVQNPNVEYVAGPTQYIFRVYDRENVLIGVREGTADIPPTKTFPIFEQGFSADQRIPVTTFFEFTRDVQWKKYQGSKAELEVTDIKTSNLDTAPRIDAVLVNKTINRYAHVEVVALVYDEKGNAMAASRTFIDDLQSTASAPLFFTWPKPFPSTVSKVEIIPKLSIDSTLK